MKAVVVVVDIPAGNWSSNDDDWNWTLNYCGIFIDAHVDFSISSDAYTHKYMEKQKTQIEIIFIQYNLFF